MASPLSVHVAIDRNVPDALESAKAKRQELVTKLADNCIEIASLELMQLMGDALRVSRSRATAGNQSEG